jgi:hypothetical protein
MVKAPAAAIQAEKAPMAAPPTVKAPAAAIPVEKAPIAAAPIAAPPTVKAPAAAIPAAKAAIPATPVSAAPERQDPGLKQAIKQCQGKFQGIYMEMYVELGLVSNFDRLRTEVARRLREDDETFRAISDLGMAPEEVIFMQIASSAGSALQSGEHHKGKGQLSIQGQELLKVYRHALDAMRKKGSASQADVQSKLDFIDKRVRELGG